MIRAFALDLAPVLPFSSRTMKTKSVYSEGENTLFDGEAEFMAHRSGKHWTGAYAYRRDVADGYYPKSWQWRDGQNALFVHLVSPLPSVAVNALRARGFHACGND